VLSQLKCIFALISLCCTSIWYTHDNGAVNIMNGVFKRSLIFHAVIIFHFTPLYPVNSDFLLIIREQTVIMCALGFDKIAFSLSRLGIPPPSIRTFTVRILYPHRWLIRMWVHHCRRPYENASTKRYRGHPLRLTFIRNVRAAGYLRLAN